MQMHLINFDLTRNVCILSAEHLEHLIFVKHLNKRAMRIYFTLLKIDFLAL